MFCRASLELQRPWVLQWRKSWPVATLQATAMQTPGGNKRQQLQRFRKVLNLELETSVEQKINDFSLNRVSKITKK